MVKTPQITPDWVTGIYIGNGAIAKKNEQGEYSRKDKKEFLQNALSALFEMTEAAEKMGIERVTSATNICEDTVIKELGYLNSQREDV